MIVRTLVFQVDKSLRPSPCTILHGGSKMKRKSILFYYISRRDAETGTTHCKETNEDEEEELWGFFGGILYVLADVPPISLLA